MADTRVFPKDFNAAIRGTRLSFRGFRVEASGTRGLFGYPGFLRIVAKVTDLDLSGNRIGTAGLEAIASLPIAGQIDSLTLTDCALDAESVAILERFDALELLTIDDNPIGSEGAARLAGLPNASRLQEVNVSGCSVGTRGLAALRGSLRSSCFSAAFAAHEDGLGSEGSLMPTILLSLHGSPLGEAGLRDLVAWAPKPATLMLQHVGLTDAGLNALASAGVFDRARHVDLRGNALSQSALANAPFKSDARVQTSLELDELRALRGRSQTFTTDALEDGYVFACPYCREVHDVGQPLCRHCGGDVTLDAGYEEPDDYVARRVRPCPHCSERCAARAMRCPSCRSWLPPS